jgi:Nudix hydrolase domain
MVLKLHLSQHCAPVTCASILEQVWDAAGRKGIWLKIPSDKGNLVPVATSAGFYFHHAERVSTWRLLLSSMPPSLSRQRRTLERHGQPRPRMQNRTFGSYMAAPSTHAAASWGVVIGKADPRDMRPCRSGLSIAILLRLAIRDQISYLIEATYGAGLRHDGQMASAD